MKGKLNMEEEYIVITESDSDIQKKLNQWRHIYHIKILGMCSRNDSVTYLIVRFRKEGA